MNTEDNKSNSASADDNADSSQSFSEVEKNAFTQRELANETIEQEAEVSGHSEAGDVHVKDNTEPAPPGQPKSIANGED
ncbi:MAG TPA: hypothetical protein VF622_10620 [Segetibacter sp.]|jgi:hypothetical protein